MLQLPGHALAMPADMNLTGKAHWALLQQGYGTHSKTVGSMTKPGTLPSEYQRVRVIVYYPCLTGLPSQSGWVLKAPLIAALNPMLFRPWQFSPYYTMEFTVLASSSGQKSNGFASILGADCRSRMPMLTASWAEIGYPLTPFAIGNFFQVDQ